MLLQVDQPKVAQGVFMAGGQNHWWCDASNQ